MSANTETTMSPAELLGTLDDAGGSLVHAQREGITTTVSYDQLVKARTAVVALIEREAELVADLARVSEELGLPPKIGPAPGVIAAMKAENKAQAERVKALEEALAAHAEARNV